MKQTFATYEHTTLGFPGVVLKWTLTNGAMDDGAYLAVKGRITRPWTWRNQYPLPFITDECERFDAWVRTTYSNQPEVQG
jgi:hypothetical protein